MGLKKSDYTLLSTDKLRQEAIDLVGYAKIHKCDLKVEEMWLCEDYTSEVEAVKRAMYLYYIAEYFEEI